MATTTHSRLFLLDIGLGTYPNGKGRILSCRPDGSNLHEIVGNIRTLPDGIAIDVANQHIYWTNMGKLGVNDGSIQRCDLSGANIVTIVPEGKTHTPKQLVIAQRSKKIYWSDREGMKVMRANMDGSDVEILYQPGVSDEDRRDYRNWCVGIAVDEEAGRVYWTQKGPSKGNQGRILYMGLDFKPGESSTSRTDVHILLANLPEPIDLEIDHASKTLYWTDRGDPPHGNSVNSISLVGVSTEGSTTSPERKILVRKLHEGIGLALDTKNSRMFFGDLGGAVYSSNLDGTNKNTILDIDGEVTGVAFVEC